MSFFKSFLLIFLFLFHLSSVKADELLPSSMIFFDYPGSTVLVVDKSYCRLMVYQFQDEWELKQSFSCTTGKKTGDKLREGDLKTPNGVYWLFKSWSGLELAEYFGKAANVYGVGSFELTYPNYLDLVLYGKNGDGIWIHGTSEGEPVATRGCISVSNPDFLDLSQFVTLASTPVIIKEEVRFVNAQQRNQKQQALLAFVELWKRAWESDDVEHYLSFYSEKFRTGGSNYKSWAKRKRVLNKRIEQRKIHISDLSILESKNVVHVRFVQDYSSSNITDIGMKELFITQENGQYKIISENWSRLKSPQPATLQYAYQDSEESAL